MLMQKIRISNWLCLFLCAGMLLSCHTDDDFPDGGTIHTCKVAVLMERGEQARWERTAAWVQENIAEAQRGMKDQVKLELTFKSQDDADILQYMQQVAEDPEIAAIIGPTTSSMAEQMVVTLSKSKAGSKPMITPACTGVEYQRQFAGVPFVWNMAESDIAQLEVLLSGDVWQ